MLRSFHSIYKFIIQATVAGFGVLFTGLCMLVVYLFFDNILWYIPFFIVSLVISIVAGSYLHVLLSIPFQLPQDFDRLKNKVALGEYNNLQEFQDDVANFVMKFFSFVGADVVGAKFHFINCVPTIKECDIDFTQLNKESFNKRNKARLSEQHKAYHLPIQLGDEHLGYIILITKGYTLPLFYSILVDFENYYLDDQIKHFVR